MKEITLQATKREIATKGTVHAMRREGRIPGVAYGDDGAPYPLTFDEKSFQTVLRSEGGRNALISLQIENKTHPVLIKEIQRHPITRALWHVDFHRVSLKKKIETSVPLHVTGEAPGVKVGGGVLEHVVREVRVRCLPTEIPTGINIDVSTLQINQAIKAKELKIPEGVELLIDVEAVIINVVSPTILEEPTAEAVPGAAATGEPEVIKKGKTEEGEEGAAAGAKPAAGAAAGAKPAAGAAGAKPAAAAKPEAKK
jgi:large subunit ribosomal protein L25